MSDEGARAAVHDFVSGRGPVRALAVAADGSGPVAFPDALSDLVDEVIAVASGFDAVHRDHHGAVIAAFQRVARSGSTQLRVDDATGAPVDVCLFDASSEFGCYLAVVVPASGESPATAEQSAGLPRRFGWTVAASGRIETVHPNVISRLGWDEDELIGGFPLWMVHPDDRDRGIADWLDVLSASAGIARSRRRFATASGEWVWGEVCYENRLDDPDHRDVVVEILDVTEEMAALDALRDREELLAKLTEALPSGVLHLDGSGATEFVNSRWQQLTGVSSDSLQDFCDAVSEPRDLKGLIDASVRSDFDTDLEIQLGVEGHPVEFASLRIRPLDSGTRGDRGLLLVLDDVTMQRRRRERLTTAALQDPLTGVLNRGGVEAELSLLLRGSDPLTAFFCDLDGLKVVNDLYGHAAGDEAIRQLADALVAAARDGDVVGRWGGDEFVLVLRATESAAVAQIVDEIGERLRRWSPTEPDAPRLRCSIGIARSEPDDDVATLLDRADAAMYEVKSLRRRRRSDQPRRPEETSALVGAQPGSLGAWQMTGPLTS